MDPLFVTIAILFTTILIMCLVIIIQLRKGLAGTDNTLIYNKLLEQQNTIQDLRLQLAQLLATETAKITDVMNVHFTKSQEQGFTMQSKVQESLTELIERVQTRLNEGVKHLNETTSQQLQLLSKTNQEKLSHIQESVEKRMDDNQRAYIENFARTKEDLAKMQQAASLMREVSNDSKASIEKLNTIFGKGATKSYGTFAEQMLEQVLQETIPGAFQKQFTIPKTHEIIDFCITLDTETIGIDAKFPLDSYDAYRTAPADQQEEQRKIFVNAVKTMCDDISKKYVASKFFKQVYIYFPSDSIYLEVVNDATLSKMFRTKGVYPSSPSTILPMIAVVAQYNKRVKVQDSVETIVQGLNSIDKYLAAFSKHYEQVGEKLRLAQERYHESEKQLSYLDSTITGLTSSSNITLESKKAESLQ